MGRNAADGLGGIQAALPFAAFDKIATWALPLRKHRARLAALAQGLPVQFGGPVGNGGNFGRSGERLRARLAEALQRRDAAPYPSASFCAASAQAARPAGVSS